MTDTSISRITLNVNSSNKQSKDRIGNDLIKMTRLYPQKHSPKYKNLRNGVPEWKDIKHATLIYEGSSTYIHICKVDLEQRKLMEKRERFYIMVKKD